MTGTARQFEVLEGGRGAHAARTRGRGTRAGARAAVFGLAKQAFAAWGVPRSEEIAESYAESLPLLLGNESAVGAALALNIAALLGANTYRTVLALKPKPKRPWWLFFAPWKIAEYRRREEREARRWKIAAVVCAATPCVLACLFFTAASRSK